MAGAKAPVVIGGGEFFFIFVWEIRLTTTCFVHRLHRPGGSRELRRAEHEPGRGHDGTARHGPSLVPGDRGALREPVRVQGYDVSQKRQGQGHQQGIRRRRRISRARRRRVHPGGPRDRRRRSRRGHRAVRRPGRHPGTVPGRHQGGRDLRGVGRGSRAQVRVRHR